MNKNIAGLEPKTLWKHFAALCSIPHPSKHEEGVRKYIVDFAEKNGIECHVDPIGNVVLRKEATPGYEGRKGIVMQGHMDMVPQKNNDKVFDFLKDAIEPYIDGEWVTADGTTLGADNGIGAAAALSVFEEVKEHGLIEALFTVDEETGMTGVFGMKKGDLKGDILLNLDSESEGELYVGCAGGVDVISHIPVEREGVPAGHVCYKVVAGGMKGGHSGMEIILQRGNSNKVLARFVDKAMRQLGVRLVSINGGDVRNAIPREGSAVVAVDGGKSADFEKLVAECEHIFKSELAAVEPELSFKAERCDDCGKVMTERSARAVVSAVIATPNGVIRMSDAMEGLVETSCNLGVVKTQDDEVVFISLPRSSVDTAKDAAVAQIRAVAELAGGHAETAGGYPGWNPNMSSPILATMKELYKKLYGKEPEVMAIHAGLECAIIGSVYENLDMISFGPTIRYPHSPDEKVNIESVGKFYSFLCQTIENAPAK
ncbi:MAG: aminoacyl-histidine dipeptidase [Rikenellaceae bacterium]|nr:aminoacyl-histidine dipeptidase [Rikenellaceae bacterium]MDE7355949.1 aminoacyl-histidine dipeptidase [Rikenellaceae bacterium]